MKPGKVFFCTFFVCHFGALLCTKPGKIQKVVTCAHTTTESIEALRLCSSCSVYEYYTKKVQG